MSDDRNPDDLRAKIIGLGDFSARKSYYPELQKKLADLERFRELINKTTEGIIQAQAENGEIIEINERACSMLGQTLGSARAKAVYELFEPAISQEIKAFADGQSPYNLPSHTIMTRFSLFTGEIIYAELSLRLVLFKETTYLVILLRDITEKKKADDFIRESEEKFRAITEQLSELVFISNQDGIIQYTSGAILQLFSYTPEEVMGRHFSAFLAVTYTPDLWQHMVIEMTNRKSAREIEILLKRADGTTFLAEVSLSKFSLQNIEGFLGIVRDITEKREAEKKIRKLSKGLEQSSAAILITDMNGRIEYANPKFIETSGYSEDEIIGANPRLFKSELTPPEIFTDMWTTIMSGHDWQGELHNRKKNGEHYWIHIFISPILDERGRITNFIGVNEDITEKKRMIDELIEAKNVAEQMNKIKSSFLANMSHELRTPLMGILGNAELLRTYSVDATVSKRANTIIKSGKRLLETFDQILNLSALEAKSFNIKLENVDVIKVMLDVIEQFITPIHAKGLWLKTNFEMDHLTLRLNRSLFMHSVSNLVSNAIKFTDEGGIDLHTYIHEKAAAKYLYIDIKDSGIGIAPEKQDLIWDAFRQASEGLGRAFEGTGLGLTISKRFIDLLGGTLTLESYPDKGSVFTIKFPVNENNMH